MGTLILGNLTSLACGGAYTTTGVGAGGKGFGFFASSILFIFKQTSKIVLSNAISPSPKFLSLLFIEIMKRARSLHIDGASNYLVLFPSP